MTYKQLNRNENAYESGFEERLEESKAAWSV